MVIPASSFASPDGLQQRMVRSHRMDLPGFHFHLTTAKPFAELVFEHVHEHHTIFVVFAGRTRRCRGTTEGAPPQESPDAPGTMSFVPAGRRHRSVLVNGAFVSGYLSMGPELIEAACDRRIVAWAPAYNMRCKRLFAELGHLNRTAEQQGGIPQAVLEGMQYSLARSIARSFAGFRARPDDARLHPAALRRVLELMDQPAAASLSLTEMAQAAGLSTSAFTRAFRGSVGQTPGQYIQRPQARRLLATTDLSSSTIAARLGFSDSAHFANTFRRLCGSSPGKFRQGGEPSE